MAERPPLPPFFQRMTDGINNATKKLTEQSHAIRRHEGWLPPEEIEARDQLLREGLALQSIDDLRAWQERVKAYVE